MGVGEDEVSGAALCDPDVTGQVADEGVGLSPDALEEAMDDDDEDDGRV